MANKIFNTIVIGSGTSAYFCITLLNEAGKKVAVIDERPYGGTCALRGCQPKKYLVANAEAMAMAHHLLGKGIDLAPRTNWEALQALKNEFLDGRSEGEVEDFKQAGVATFSGRATLVRNNELEVNGERLTAEHIVLATGASPRRTEIPGVEHTHDSEYFLNMPDLPKRIVFIGGGFVSFEFAHVAAQAGREVTILHRSGTPLKAFDQDMVKAILEASAASGISVIPNETPTRIVPHGSGYRIAGKTGATYETDLIIEASGRLPNLSVLEGNHGNVESSSRGVAVNHYQQSVSNPRIYPIGDCAASGYQLATVADEEGKTAAHNILNGNSKSVDYSVVPSTVFTIPNLATIGLTEKQATEQKLNYRVNQGTTINWPSSKRIGEKHSGYKVLINTDDEKIIGAHLARHNASEVINIFGLAVKHGIKASELAEFMWAYPTYTSDLKYMVK
ncbi:MAG TPA: NAD(P)/FAD-dependent oxidoreductase [Verrucomicrobiales bacterium]|nr:NAD(P)/FAD-dependent oxidoreductase [Verrucomicrobiales bacterium]